jgi:hypothetical protein
LDIQVAIVDTLAPGIRFYATPESPYANDLVIAQTTRQFMTAAGAQLAINGDFYASAGVIEGYVHRNPSHFAASDGNIYSPFGSTEPAFHIGENNVAHTVVASSQSASGKLQPNPAVPVWNAVGGSDYLVQNGAIPTTWRDPAFATALHPRTAIGVSADRSRVAMFVVDGRQSHSGGMNFPEMAAMLRNDYGMHWAINLDGGGSTTMAMADPLPRVLNSPSDGSERVVANSLAVYARPAPPPIPEHALVANYQQSGVYSHVGAQILSGSPTANFADDSAFRVGYSTSLGKGRGVLSFDLSGIPQDATIHGVSLTLDAFESSGASGNQYVDLELYQLEAPVAETQVTWNDNLNRQNWETPGGDFTPPALSTLFAQQPTGLKTFVSTVDFVAAAQEALHSDQPLNLIVAALDAETWGAANSSNLHLRFRSDDAIIGQRPRMTVHFSLAGDFNRDGVVDSADYVVWRKGSGTMYTQSDLNVWRAHFGDSVASGTTATAVPEPSAWMLLAICLSLTGSLSRK